MEDKLLNEFLKYLRSKPSFMTQYAKFDETLIYEFKQLQQIKLLNLACVRESDEAPEHMEWWYSISDCYTTDLFMKYNLQKPPTEARIKEVYEKETRHSR